MPLTPIQQKALEIELSATRKRLAKAEELMCDMGNAWDDFCGVLVETGCVDAMPVSHELRYALGTAARATEAAREFIRAAHLQRN